MKINANFKTFAGMNFDSSKYIASPSYGVNRFMLVSRLNILFVRSYHVVCPVVF